MKIKEVLKKSLIVRTVFNKYSLMKLNYKSMFQFRKIEKIINKKYIKIYGEKINWSNPKTYTEKLNFSKLYNFRIEKSKLSDKYLVRDWIQKKIGKQYLIPLIGVYDSFDEINFNKLPNQFVIKCNHDSGSVTLVHDKQNINIKELKQKYDFLLKRNFAYDGYEIHYKDIKPKILIEKYMGKNINDYKFLCFNGIPYYCWIDFDRYINHKRNVYDMNWKLQKFNQKNYGNYEKAVEIPSNFDEMKNIATSLSKGFDHVRVDLYDIEGKIYFGEMTFTNGNGFEPINPRKWDIKLGNLWDLDISSREKLINKRINDIK